MDWFKGNFTSHNGVYHDIGGFPVSIFPNQSIELKTQLDIGMNRLYNYVYYIYIGIHTINIYIYIHIYIYTYIHIDPMKSIEIRTCGAAFAFCRGTD